MKSRPLGTDWQATFRLFLDFLILNIRWNQNDMCYNKEKYLRHISFIYQNNTQKF